MIFGYFTLLVALIISAVAAYYSIVGLTAIFSAAIIPIIIMGAALEIGKIVAAVWLKVNWHRAGWTYKLYLVPAVAFLMLLTSMGIFGFLSKAHNDQNLISGDVQAKIAIFDERIKTERDNIAVSRKALDQLDAQVDQRLARGNSEQGAERAVQIRRQQQAERTRLQREITTAQTNITKIQEERAPIAAEIRKVEAEVGPIKYVAALIYEDNPDTSLLERAVRWVIILIVAVFDPLALVLILAGQQSIRWARQERQEQKELEEFNSVAVNELLNDVEFAESQHANVSSSTANISTATDSVTPQTPEFDIDKHAYLKKPFVHFKNLKPMVASNLDTKDSVSAPEVDTRPEINEPTVVNDDIAENSEVNKFPKIPETAQRIKKDLPPVPETLNVRKLQADNVDIDAPNSGFGIKFPDNANKGDMFLRVDHLPNRLYKHNGFKWIEVDKDKTDSYTYDEQYIQYLIDKLSSGEYEIDQLNETEQNLVAQQLKKVNGKT